MKEFRGVERGGKHNMDFVFLYFLFWGWGEVLGWGF